MKVNFIEELRWRGMIHDVSPGTEEQLNKEMTSAYVGIDPTADSLHIGHLVSIMMLKHFQLAGHKPIALVGGATGMIGDPSGKSQERNLLDEQTLRHNQDCLRNQLAKFLDFETNNANKAELVNNYDWMKEVTFLSFIRDIGKHITVNYMMSKDSVKKRLSPESGSGMSFTEFTYQLVQGYDFLYLYQNRNCKLQMGGSDQWGNITTGTELIRRKVGPEAETFAITCPLITKADGGKFGKTETGNVWLDPEKTSPYAFYQFWLNCSDADAEKYIRIFTLLSREAIEKLIEKHREAPHLRELQRVLASEVTIMVHSVDALKMAEDASQILFGKATNETLHRLDEKTLLAIFDGVPQVQLDRKVIDEGVDLTEFLTTHTHIFASKSEARRTLNENALSMNKQKAVEGLVVGPADLLNNRYILIQKGKKSYFLVIIV
ncbi:MAG: tyrosine--tRNA ligase [Bacteroidales bacterium]|nr:tyrosine--tRNA ligase [Bacteroidales bacterium]